MKGKSRTRVSRTIDAGLVGDLSTRCRRGSADQMTQNIDLKLMNKE